MAYDNPDEIQLKIAELISTFEETEQQFKVASERLDAEYARALQHLITSSAQNPAIATIFEKSLMIYYHDQFIQLAKEKETTLKAALEEIEALRAQLNTVPTNNAEEWYNFVLFTDEHERNLRRFTESTTIAIVDIVKVLSERLDPHNIMAIAAGYVTRDYDKHPDFNSAQPLENFQFDAKRIEALESSFEALYVVRPDLRPKPIKEESQTLFGALASLFSTKVANMAKVTTNTSASNPNTPTTSLSTPALPAIEAEVQAETESDSNSQLAALTRRLDALQLELIATKTPVTILQNEWRRENYGEAFDRAVAWHKQTHDGKNPTMDEMQRWRAAAGIRGGDIQLYNQRATALR